MITPSENVSSTKEADVNEFATLELVAGEYEVPDPETTLATNSD
jgi:hypothetical protein